MNFNEKQTTRRFQNTNKHMYKATVFLNAEILQRKPNAEIDNCQMKCLPYKTER